MIDPGFLDELRARLAVSEVVGKRVQLKKAGREWKGLSPFNKERSPSFFVNDQKGFYYDFSSGKHGDIFAFVMETEGVTFPEAVERLASLAGVALPAASPEAEAREARQSPDPAVRDRMTIAPVAALKTVAAAPGVQLAKSASQKNDVFTNCGKADNQKTPAKSAKKKLTRVPFTVSRLTEFCTRRELVNQTGHDVSEWALVVLKELTDNAIDACEEAEIAAVISVTVKRGSIAIEDNGLGIPATTVQSVLDYGIRVSSREAYASPTRGAQGNALKTILPMAYVLDERHGEEASGKTIIEARGLAHHIAFAVDHIRQEPKITHTTKPSPVVRGTRVTVKLPAFQCASYEVDIIEHCKERFLELAESYAWLNPHLSLRVSWDGEVKIDVKASNPTWAKWLPSWPTSPHWYDKSRFRRYMAAHIANREEITVREFISEFCGMAGTAKQKQVLLETGASHVSLHDYFGRHKTNSDNIAKLLFTLQKHTKPVRPARLGVIGKEHFYRCMEAAGGDPKTFTYECRLGKTDGVPRVIEFAFGIHRDGLTAGRGPSRKEITGVNWSPGINNPFRQLGRGGVGLDAMLSELRADASQPAILALHVACPLVAYTDRGKSAIVIEGDGRESH